MKILDLRQEGPDWHRWRAKGIGGSDSCVINRDVYWTTPSELHEIKRGERVVEENEKMRRGKVLEPLARARYIERTGIHMRPVCIEHEQYPWMRASLDGLSEDNALVLEIKCPWGERPKAHEIALSRGEYPKYYRAQLQHELACSGCSLLHFWSFTDRNAYSVEEQGVMVPVERDEDFIEALILKEKRFYNEMIRDLLGKT